MDVRGYAETAADLLNAEVGEVADLRAVLAGRPWLAGQVTDRDCMLVRRLQRELRPVFAAARDGDTRRVVDTLNALLVTYPVTPQISTTDPDDLHLHVASRHASVGELLTGESLLGLATLVCELGPGRLGVCAAVPCTRVFVDTSPNASRRYCSERCSSRANVAAHRARKRAAVPAPSPSPSPGARA
ncbi:CGNR zinc finger domain-containing protein [Nocardioides sp. SYSU D00038]|uniref:CGNR zinc finger domain-containing protein n=1 Tax=Nocardioides sp. SYSU D00038 TaxID=2812554 RepID=UPI0027DBA2F2|nr:CGNR zinc finger domain-containing protein [Nocardioides sp. SYSU D00038]